jgi:hypothetical protein
LQLQSGLGETDKLWMRETIPNGALRDIPLLVGSPRDNCPNHGEEHRSGEASEAQAFSTSGDGTPNHVDPNRFKVSRLKLGLIAGLLILAGWNFMWPAYRAFLPIEIDYNEGWNAYHASAAIGGGSPYPGPDALMTNNYPPISFFLVGELGRVTGDPVRAGRIVSLAAVLGIGAMIGIAIKKLGGTNAAAAIGGASYVATMSQFFDRYVGMNDPQMLAEAIMMGGFLLFLRAMQRGRGHLAAFAVMIVAGFTKHNIVSIPLAAMIWLALHDLPRASRCMLISLGLVCLGFVTCSALFGPDFLHNMLAPRQSSWTNLPYDIKGLGRVAVPLIAWGYVFWFGGANSEMRICGLLVAIAIPIFIWERRGSGVDYNAEFDLVIAASIAMGAAYARIPQLSKQPFFGPSSAQVALILALFVALLPLRHRESARLVFDPTFREEIANRQKLMADAVARVRSTPGIVACSPLVCFWAGKPSFLDGCNIEERVAAGNLPPDVINKWAREGSVKLVAIDSAICWQDLPEQ